ncbi:MAG: aminodeoxychorismate/anthranilate synthase component II [Dehalococcoidales bacterium]|nr:aminodeoxychorismate/anthranilate synthase component II [Dehalococcoidales bacterium]
MILLIDNYDSFTYNLYQYLSELGYEVMVVRNDRITIRAISRLAPEHIIISPGPGRPENAGISNEIIRKFGAHIPILGVCLGHQCIGYAYGAVVAHAGEIRHGKTSLIHHDGRGIFRGIDSPFVAVRYHSLAVKRETLPEFLEVSAWTENGIIMGLRHRVHPVEGVQFHPESILTAPGKEILKNFLTLYHKREAPVSPAMTVKTGVSRRGKP